ncbi:MAG: protease modulator HflC [Caulobacter sp.]|jgi:membrane protease subunit HflC|nr:protease modulator HflC [Caulobacter sp.]
MNQARTIAYGVIAVAVLFVAANTFYVVDQKHQAIILRLGEVVRTVNATPDDGPGLKVKIPFVEQPVIFDKRNQAVVVNRREILTADQERLMVDAFVRYRISDPVRFYKSLRNQDTANDRLGQIVNAALRQELGSVSSEDIIAKRRSALTRATRDNLAARAGGSRLGIQVIDVRIRSADLPEANQEAVFDRMRTARQQEAARIRAEGEQRRRAIVATATEEAETIRGQADAERAKIFASSFGKDPSFAAFYRSMQAYEASMGQDTTLVLSPDSAFFKYFGRGPSAQ